MRLEQTQRKFKPGPGHPLLGRSGQAMIEYILVVTISVIIISSLLVRMYKPMETFVKGMMGDYVECLLETGELPRLGAEDVNGECRPPLFEAEPGDGSEQGDTASNRSEGGGDLDENSLDKVGSTMGSSGGGSRRSRQTRGFVGSNNRASAGADGGSGGGKKIENALSGGGAGGGFFSSNSSSGSGARRRERYIAVTGALAEEVKKRQRPETKNTVVAQAEGVGGTRGKKIPFKPPPPPKPPAEQEIQTLDIGTLIKYFLIAGIIIALFALLGGQALQLSKSWEKGE